MLGPCLHQPLKTRNRKKHKYLCTCATHLFNIIVPNEYRCNSHLYLVTLVLVVTLVLGHIFSRLSPVYHPVFHLSGCISLASSICCSDVPLPPLPHLYKPSVPLPSLSSATSLSSNFTSAATLLAVTVSVTGALSVAKLSCHRFNSILVLRFSCVSSFITLYHSPSLSFPVLYDSYFPCQDLALSAFDAVFSFSL